MTFAVTIGVLAVVASGIAFMMPLHQDNFWAFQVRRELNYNDARKWALDSLKSYSPTNNQNFRDWLTNAPEPLLSNYRSRPQIIVDEFFDHQRSDVAYCVSLRYGGGMYDWGITVGDTNLPANQARERNVKVWAPGINYWHN